MIYFFIIACSALVFDQLSKFYILQYVQENSLYTRQYITSGNHLIDITYATNTGAAFSLFPNQQKIFVIITVIALAGILIYLLKTKDLTRFPITGLALIFGGATGNLIDRLRHGMVIDFIDFHWKEVYHWPTFNIADSAICIGVGILFIYMFKTQEQKIPAVIVETLNQNPDQSPNEPMVK